MSEIPSVFYLASTTDLVIQRMEQKLDAWRKQLLDLRKDNHPWGSQPWAPDMKQQMMIIMDEAARGLLAINDPHARRYLLAWSQFPALMSSEVREKVASVFEFH